ncbi:MAG TPA: hypothetical protein PLO75_08465, partial [Thermotogota bacterium]|nr:hypothetical protein [Thermotogota bacterium]
GLTSEAHELSRSSICLFLLQVKHAELKFGVPKNRGSRREHRKKDSYERLGMPWKRRALVRQFFWERQLLSWLVLKEKDRRERIARLR